MAWLDEHPNPNARQQRVPRREEISGVFVVHTAENTPDYVAFDGGAEAVRNFIGTRSDYGSYHFLADSDSFPFLVEWGNEAFHDATSGGNRHEVGGSVATRADVWPLAPKEWREGAVKNLARGFAQAALYVYRRRGIVVPARRISREESQRRIPGFISHAERDPARRSDPGAGFPWDDFFRYYTEFARALGVPVGGGTVEPPTNPLSPEQIEENEIMGAKEEILRSVEAALPQCVRIDDTTDAGDKAGKVYCLSAAGKWWVQNEDVLKFLYASNLVRFDDGAKPPVAPWKTVRLIPDHPNTK